MLIPIPSFLYDLFSGPGVPTFGSATRAALGKALPVGRDLLLDTVTGDLKLVGGDLALVADNSAIRQEVDLKLNFLLGEWFLDVTLGVPYLQVVLVKSPNIAAVESVLRDAILDCVGISSIASLTLSFDRASRKLSVRWSATTDLGELITGNVTRS